MAPEGCIGGPACLAPVAGIGELAHPALEDGVVRPAHMALQGETGAAIDPHPPNVATETRTSQCRFPPSVRNGVAGGIRRVTHHQKELRPTESGRGRSWFPPCSWRSSGESHGVAHGIGSTPNETPLPCRTPGACLVRNSAAGPQIMGWTAPIAEALRHRCRASVVIGEARDRGLGRDQAAGGVAAGAQELADGAGQVVAVAQVAVARDVLHGPQLFVDARDEVIVGDDGGQRRALQCVLVLQAPADEAALPNQGRPHAPSRSQLPNPTLCPKTSLDQLNPPKT